MKFRSLIAAFCLAAATSTALFGAHSASAYDIIGIEGSSVVTDELNGADDSDQIVVWVEAGQRIQVLVESNEIDPYVRITDTSGYDIFGELTYGGYNANAVNDDMTSAGHALDYFHVATSTNSSLITAPVAESGYYWIEVGNALPGDYANSDEYYETNNPGGWAPTVARDHDGAYTATVTIVD